MNLFRSRLAVMALFFVAGTAMGSWYPRIPEVQRDLNLSHGELGLALIGPAVGALLAMPTTSWLIARTSSRTVSTTAAFLLCAVLVLPVISPSLGLLFLALLLLGAANGVLDIAMNVQAVGVEQRYHRPIMSAFHGLWSVGGLVGAAAAGLAASAGLAAREHLLLVGIVMAIITAGAFRYLLPPAEDEVHDGPAFVRPTRALAGLGIIAFCALISEGAIADWSAVYLRNTLDTTPAYAAAGYAVFAAAMVVGRFTGDWATVRLKPFGIITYGGVLVAVGLGVGLLIGEPWSALVGFAAVGVGLASAFPVLLSVAGQMSDMPPGMAISAVAMFGYTGFLVGPPVIGFVAQATGLRIGLSMVVLLGLAMVVLARFVSWPGNDAPPA